MARYQIDNVAYPILWEESDPNKKRIQRAKNLLMCRMGEVPYDRFRGFDQGMVELPMEELRARLLPELDRLMLWETEVEVVDATVTLLPNSVPYIRVVVEARE